MNNKYSYASTEKAFNTAISRLKANLQYLKDNTDVSDRFLRFQEVTIKALEAYQKQSELIISDLEYSNMGLMLGKSREFTMLRNNKIALEAICLIHGINDYPLWLDKGVQYLVSEAHWFMDHGELQLSSQHMEMLENLPNEDKETIEDIFTKHRKRRQARERKEFEMSLENPT